MARTANLKNTCFPCSLGIGSMKIGFIGLGRMGFPMVERLLKHKISVVAFNRSPEKTIKIAKKSATPSFSYAELISKLPKRKIIWIMLPAGIVTETAVKELIALLKKDDVIINGANDFFKNAQMHDEWCKKKGIHYFDIGVSGGIWGLKNGYTLMIGGPQQQFKKIEPLCKILAPKNGYGLFGNVGSGHFVKSVHNIVEYIYLQGLAEGMELLSNYPEKISLQKASQVWQPASVIRSWLLDLTNVALSRKDFKDIEPKINSVTLQELKQTVDAIKGNAPSFRVAAQMRQDTSNSFILGKKIIAAVRREFGGHVVEKK